MLNFISDSERFGQGFLSNHSTLFLLLSNIIMIFVAVFEEWDLITIMFIYWCQSVIIGIFTFFKILNLKNFTTEGIHVNNLPVGPTTGVKIGIAFFFLFHYGFFHFGYLNFLIFDPFFNTSPKTSFINLTILFIIFVFFINHLFSFLYNRKKDAQKKQNIGKVMVFPYVRIVPMHLTIIFGSFFIMSGAPQMTLVLFLLLKTFADVAMHIVEHREAIASKIKIALDEENYSLGDIISGKIQLEFTSPIKAKSLQVGLVAEKITIQTMNQQTYKEIFYQDVKTISAEKYYGNEIYDFFIRIPDDLFIRSNECLQNGKMAQARQMAEKVQKWGINVHFQVYDKFYIKAILDVPMSLDITNTQEFTIS